MRKNEIFHKTEYIYVVMITETAGGWKLSITSDQYRSQPTVSSTVNKYSRPSVFLSACVRFGSFDLFQLFKKLKEIIILLRFLFIGFGTFIPNDLQGKR